MKFKFFCVYLITLICTYNLLYPEPLKIDSRIPAYHRLKELNGSLIINDSPLCRLWATDFSRIYPAVKITFSSPITSTDQAVNSLINNKSDLVWLGPDLQKYQEELFLKSKGEIPTMTPVAFGGARTHGNKPAIAIFVNENNPISRASLQELDAIFSDSRKSGYKNPIKVWGDLGLSGPWKKIPIKCIGMSINNQSGVPHGWVYFLMNHMLFGGTFRNDLIQIPDTAYGPGANRAFVKIIDMIKNDKTAIGFAPLEYKQNGVKNLLISKDQNSTYYDINEKTITEGNYPLSQIKTLAYLKNNSNRVVLEFLKFCTSKEGQSLVLQDPEKSLPIPYSSINR